MCVSVCCLQHLVLCLVHNVDRLIDIIYSSQLSGPERELSMVPNMIIALINKIEPEDLINAILKARS